jgi:spore germination cell wall hydrolase CwlJ-like protein
VHLSGLIPDITGGATHYHSTKVFPEWAYTGQVTANIHKHVFYTGVR